MPFWINWKNLTMIFVIKIAFLEEKISLCQSKTPQFWKKCGQKWKKFFFVTTYLFITLYLLLYFPAINTFSTPSQRFNFYSLENHKKWTKKILELDISIYSSTFKDKLKVMIHEHWFFILNLSSVIFLFFCIHPIIMFMNSERSKYKILSNN